MTRRHKVARVLLSASFLGGVVAGSWSWLDLHETRDSRESTHAAIHQTRRRLATLNDDPTAPPQPEWEIASRAELTRDLVRIDALAGQSGVSVGRVNAPDPTDDAWSQFTMRGIGTPTQVTNLLSLVERERRLLLVTKLRITAVTGDEVGFELHLTRPIHSSGEQR